MSLQFLDNYDNNKLRLKFMVEPKNLEYFTYVKDAVKIRIIDCNKLSKYKLLGDSGMKMAKKGFAVTSRASLRPCVRHTFFFSLLKYFQREDVSGVFLSLVRGGVGIICSFFFCNGRMLRTYLI